MSCWKTNQPFGFVIDWDKDSLLDDHRGKGGDRSEEFCQAVSLGQDQLYAICLKGQGYFGRPVRLLRNCVNVARHWDAQDDSAWFYLKSR